MLKFIFQKQNDVMIISISGTPGTGKSSVAKLVSRSLNAELVDLTKFIRKRKLSCGFDRSMKSMIVEIEAIGKEFHNFMRESKPEVIVVEGHLSHFVSPDICFVLRLQPDILEKRLKKRQYSKAKIMENIRAEILDIVYAEAVEKCKRAMQINATGMEPAKLAERILNTLRSKKYRSDKIDWSKRYQKYLK